MFLLIYEIKKDAHKTPYQHSQVQDHFHRWRNNLQMA